MEIAPTSTVVKVIVLTSAAAMVNGNDEIPNVCKPLANDAAVIVGNEEEQGVVGYHENSQERPWRETGGRTGSNSTLVYLHDSL